MDALTLGDAGSRGQRCERYPLLLLLLDKESGESGDDARAGAAGRGRGGYGVADGGGGGGGGGGYRRFDHEGGRGGERLARGAAALLGSWPRHLMVALVAALALGFSLLLVVMVSAWLSAPVAHSRTSRYCAGGACGQVSPDLDLRLQLDVALGPAPHHDAQLDGPDSALPSALEVSVYRLEDAVAAPASETDPASPVQLVVSAAVERVLDPADNSGIDPSSVVISDTDDDTLLQLNDRFAEELISEPTQEDAVFESAMDLLLAAADSEVASPPLTDKDSDRLPASFSTILIYPESDKGGENPTSPTAFKSSSGSAIDLILQAAVDQVLETALDLVDDSNYDSDVTSVELDLDSQGKRTVNNTIADSVNSTSRMPLESTDDSVLEDLILLAARAERALESVLDHADDSVVQTDRDRSQPLIDSINKIIRSGDENSDVDSSKNFGMKLVYLTEDPMADSDPKHADDSSIQFFTLPGIQSAVVTPLHPALNIDSRPALDLEHIGDLTWTPSYYPKEYSSSHISSKPSVISDLETDLKTVSDPVLDSLFDMTLNLALKSSNPANIEKDHTMHISHKNPEVIMSPTTVKRPLQEDVTSSLTAPFLFGGVILPHSRSKEISLSTFDSPWPSFIHRRQTPLNAPLTDLFTDSALRRGRESEKYHLSPQSSPRVISQLSSTDKIEMNLMRNSNPFLRPKIVSVSAYPFISVSGFSQLPDTSFATKHEKLPSFAPILNFNSISELDDVPNKKSQLLPSHSNDFFESTDSIMLPLLSSIAKNIAIDLKDAQPAIFQPPQFLSHSSWDTLPFSLEKAKFPNEDSASATIAQFSEGSHPLADTGEDILRFERQDSRFSKEREHTEIGPAIPFTFLTFSSSIGIAPKPFSQTPKSNVNYVASPYESFEQICTCNNRNMNTPNPRRFFYVPPIERPLSHHRTYDVHQEFPILSITRTACPCQKCMSALQGLPRGNHYPTLSSLLPDVPAQPFRLGDASSRSPCMCGCMNSRGPFAGPSQATRQILRPLSSVNNTRPCQVEMVSVEKIGPRRCYRPDAAPDIPATIVTERSKSTKPQSSPPRKGERSWAWRRFVEHALPEVKTAALEKTTASVRSASPPPSAPAEGDARWAPGATPWTAPLEAEGAVEEAPEVRAARPERPLFFVVGDGDPLTREHVCALESAARFNPRSPVHVLVLSPHAAGRHAHWPAPRDAHSTAAAALHAVLGAYHGAIQVVAVGEELFSRSPLRALWEQARAVPTPSPAASTTEDESVGDDDAEGEAEGEGKGEGEVRFGAALRLGARLLALWEFGGMALEPSLLSLRNASAADLHTKRYYTDAVRLDTKEALALSVSEECHPLVFELLRALAAEAAAGRAEGASQAGLLRRAVTRALPDFCRAAHDHASTAALEVGDDGALAVRVQCAPAAPVPDRLLCRARAPPQPNACLWAPGPSLDLQALHDFCPVTAEIL